MESVYLIFILNIIMVLINSIINILSLFILRISHSECFGVVIDRKVKNKSFKKLKKKQEEYKDNIEGGELVVDVWKNNDE